ncbi:hypothetical protein [Streptomyces pristinaespiralis]|uniref:hypothetical protein n=1 Tax=Streptomyces pristinaespiralis TaxID=38300 RepID=UPI0033D25EDC
MPGARTPGRHRAPSRPKVLLGLCAVLGAGALLGGAALMLGDGGETVGEPAPVADIEVGGRPNLITPTDRPSPTPSDPGPSSAEGGPPVSSPASSPGTSSAPASSSASTPATATASALASSSPSSGSTTAAATPTSAPSPSETWRDRDDCRDDRDHPGGGRWDRDECW